MATEQFSNAATTTLASGISSVATTLTVSSATKFPTVGQFRLLIDDEIMLVTGVSGTTFTVVRASEGTTNVIHSAGTVVIHPLTAGAMLAFQADTLSSVFSASLSGSSVVCAAAGVTINGPSTFITGSTLLGLTGSTVTLTGKSSINGTNVCLTGSNLIGLSGSTLSATGSLMSVDYSRTFITGSAYLGLKCNATSYTEITPMTTWIQSPVASIQGSTAFNAYATTNTILGYTNTFITGSIFLGLTGSSVLIAGKTSIDGTNVCLTGSNLVGLSGSSIRVNSDNTIINGSTTIDGTRTFVTGSTLLGLKGTTIALAGNTTIDGTNSYLTGSNLIGLSGSSITLSSDNITLSGTLTTIGVDGVASTLQLGPTGAGAVVTRKLTTGTGDNIHIQATTGGSFQINANGNAFGWPDGVYGNGTVTYIGANNVWGIQLSNVLFQTYLPLRIKSSTDSLPLTGDSILFGSDDASNGLTGVTVKIRAANLTLSSSVPNSIAIETGKGPTIGGTGSLNAGGGAQRVNWSDVGVQLTGSLVQITGSNIGLYGDTILMRGPDSNNAAFHAQPQSWNSGKGTLFLGDCTVVPVAAPVSGVYLYVESGSLKAMSPSGYVATLCPA